MCTNQALSKKSDDASRRASSHSGPPPSSVARFSRKAVADAAAWAGNISSSVLIIFVNKYLMGRKGYDFHYGEFGRQSVSQSLLFFFFSWRRGREMNERQRGKKTQPFFLLSPPPETTKRKNS